MTIAPVNISINNDNILEANETFKLAIYRIRGDINVRRFVHFGTPRNATVTIIDNDCKFLLLTSNIHKLRSYCIYQ